MSRTDDTPPGDTVYPGIGHAVQAILTSPAEQDKFENLYRRAQEHLNVFDDPRYSHLDTPRWVTTAVRGTSLFTVRNVVKAMYDTAADLGLDRLGPGGRRYVAAAICACAAEANAGAESELVGPSSAENAEALARGLQRLASTWAAFLLWPFYAHGWQKKRVIYPSGRASAAASSTPPWFRAPGKSERESLQRSPAQSEGILEKRVLARDGHRCVLSGFVDRRHYERLMWAGCTDLPDGYQDDLKPVNFFKRSLAVYSSPSGSQGGRDEFDSMAVTLEILQHYCGLDRTYVDDAVLMDRPMNAITVTPHFQKRFECLTLCLKPTLMPHCYEVRDYEPMFNHLKVYRVPPQIMFKNHTRHESDGHRTAPREPPSSASNPGEALQSPPSLPQPTHHERGGSEAATEAEPELPDPALIRVHAALVGVLHLSGAYATFGRLFLPLEDRGHSAYPSTCGSAFWRSVVEYEGPESCVEVELRGAVRALRRSVASRAREARSVE
ncbi:hypothetical protein V8D89_006661 [Ganoderma adspersum]